MLKILKTVALLFLLVSLVTAGEIFIIKFKGVINPVSAAYLEKEITRAEAKQAELVIIQLDTPGGLQLSMRKVVQKILASKVPVVTQVYPRGARAASAGLFIALASDYAAMAAGTNLGAAHPIYINGGKVSEKITNDAAAFIRSLAEKRGRNAVWAEEAVRNSVSITETEALKLNVTDFLADTAEEIILKIDGKAVPRLNGKQKLALKGKALMQIKMSGWETALQTAGDPDIVYMLFILGIFGIIFEFIAPGSFVPGLLGSSCLLVALVSMGSISISIAGASFLALAFILIILELKTPAHGTLGILGLLSMLLGSFMLFNPLAPYFKISLPLVILMVVLIGGLFALLVYLGIASMKGKAISGRESLPGAFGEVKTELAPAGIVYVQNEDWSAESADGTAIGKGEKVVVIEVVGAKIIVERKK